MTDILIMYRIELGQDLMFKFIEELFEKIQDGYLREGLIQEIKIMQKLKSSYIATFLDVMKMNNNYYIIQEYCDGGNFDEQIYIKYISDF
ncbi:unnamed protein product [Paramecium primaurelia]|uniref:Protein kinase domain-containing protein n=1 Tax=Paramecium primaurelia TaxID=5886 RepID=A0A8S1QG41_PARPR|nr:unnamed protein product [Paramecium primaurelia]